MAGKKPQAFFRTKPLDTIMDEAREKKGGLKRVLSAFDLTLIGVGAMIGAGIFVLTGTAAKEAAGPAIMLSYVFAGAACILAALCYAEFAARLPISGSVYTYSYASVGELFAWIIGWDLVLEYTIGSSTVAVAWTKYLEAFLPQISGLTAVPLPRSIDLGLFVISEANVVAGVAIALLSVLLAVGIKESARFNAAMVAVKIGVILFVILAGLFFLNPGNWAPFFPYDIDGNACSPGDLCFLSVFSGAGLVFFSYIGFDAVSATAEEVKNPQRDLPIGIIGSLLICTLLYVTVSAIITGMVPYHQIDQGAPLAKAFTSVGFGFAENLIGIGGVAGLSTVMLVLLMSQPRIYFSMARDGLLPQWFARVHDKFRTPLNATVVTGTIAALVATFIPLEDLHYMVSIGTLFAFMMVCASVLILRYKKDAGDLESTALVFGMITGMALIAIGYRSGWEAWILALIGLATAGPIVQLFLKKGVNIPETFKTPWVPLLPILGIISMIAMMAGLEERAWERLGWWLVAGLLIYVFYGIRHSKLRG